MLHQRRDGGGSDGHDAGPTGTGSAVVRRGTAMRRRRRARPTRQRWCPPSRGTMVLAGIAASFLMTVAMILALLRADRAYLARLPDQRRRGNVAGVDRVFADAGRSSGVRRQRQSPPPPPQLLPVNGGMKEKGWDSPIVHIVNTRFMQDQTGLPHLARARLRLFRTFCLPTVIAQEMQEFVWIIKTDPGLDADVRNEMIDLLRPYPHFFLVGSNKNFLVGIDRDGAWRDGAEGRDIFSKPELIYTGDLDLLQRAHKAEAEKIVLQTRLDADDGLNKGYLRHVQQSALEMFGPVVDDGGGLRRTVPSAKWLYWCSRRNIEWFVDPSFDRGEVMPVEHQNLCVTPGVTVGFNVGTSQSDVPRHHHDKLIKSLRGEGGCGLERKASCLAMVDDFVFAAVRSRTPTSAGMYGLQPDDRQLAIVKARPELGAVMWSLLPKEFAISDEAMKETNAYIQENIVKIAMDNLKGQCTAGHSCKLSSKDLLQRYTELAVEKGNSIDVQAFKSIKR